MTTLQNSTQAQSTLQELDRKLLWHPFTQHGLEADFLPVIKAQGAYLELEDGRKILDAISSWWVNLHGHSHPAISQAIYDQAHNLEHVIFAGFTHEPAIMLAQLLVQAAQDRGTALARCFYSDNGATAVEVALKMAFQYHKNLGVNTRTRFIALNDSYHGDTLGGMAVSARGSYHKSFSELLPEVDFVPAGDIAALKACLAHHPKQHAALIVEPLVQGANGMQMYSAEYLHQAAILCKESGVLLICDEVFSGFYRTGKCFAFEHAQIQPDLVCLSKGITGGFLPLGVTLATEAIFAAYHSKELRRAFWHSHSYTANPLSCAAAITSWKLLHQPATQAAIQRISQRTQEWVAKLAQHKNCATTRTLGTIGAVEIQNCPDYFSADFAPRIRKIALENGVLIRPLGAVLYALPPYCVSDKDLDKIYGVIELLLEEAPKFF